MLVHHSELRQSLLLCDCRFHQINIAQNSKMKHNKAPPPPTVPALARISDPLLELLVVEVSISGFEIHTVANCQILHG